MKKLLSLCLVALMILPLVSLAACSSKGFDYRNEDLSAFVTLPKGYKETPLTYKIKDLADTVTDDDIYEDFEEMLAAIGAFYEKVTTGPIYYGDRIGLLYKGVLRSNIAAIAEMDDKTASEYLYAMSEDDVTALSGFSGGSLLTEAEITPSTELVIGSGQFISGFEDAIIDQDVKLGDKNVPLLLKFPTSYSNKDLAGKDVVFFVSPVYKWLTKDAEKLEKGLVNGSVAGSKLSITYKAECLRNAQPRVTDEGAEGYLTEEQYTALFNKMCDEFEEGTWDTDIEGKPVRDDQGNIVYKEVSEIATISESSEWLVQLMLDFNQKVEDGENPFTTYNFEVTRNVTWTEDTETDAIPMEKQLIVGYTITVHSIPEPKVISPKDGIVDGTAGEHQITFSDFAERVKKYGEENETALTVDIATYPTYAQYFAYIKDQTQFQRTIQIRSNKYHAVYNAVAALTTIDYEHETVKKLIQDYVNEVKNNVDYWYTSAQVSGYSSIYDQIASQSGYSSAKDYYMYYTYGATSSTLQTVAKSKITDNLIFWQLVKTENVAVNDTELNAGLESYKAEWEKLGQEIDWNEIDREDVREALLWDKVAETFIQNGWIDFTGAAVK